jgi:PKHD-type hydroxylase
MAHLPIWYLGEISPEDCDKALAEYMHIFPHSASMGANGEEVKHAYRNTTVRFATKDHWFGELLRDHGVRANTECQWGYDISDYEAVQFAQYSVAQHYKWHVDNFPLAGLPTDRKVSVVCLMTDPSEFEGGLLQLRLYQEYTAPLTKGSVIAFPSIIEHQVTPVVSGLRATATMWLNGPRFR